LRLALVKPPATRVLGLADGRGMTSALGSTVEANGGAATDCSRRLMIGLGAKELRICV
jgi:hypothetical protein